MYFIELLPKIGMRIVTLTEPPATDTISNAGFPSGILEFNVSIEKYLKYNGFIGSKKDVISSTLSIFPSK